MDRRGFLKGVLAAAAVLGLPSSAVLPAAMSAPLPVAPVVFDGLTFGGIPITVDPYCPSGTMFLIDRAYLRSDPLDAP